MHTYIQQAAAVFMGLTLGMPALALAHNDQDSKKISFSAEVRTQMSVGPDSSVSATTSVERRGKEKTATTTEARKRDHLIEKAREKLNLTLSATTTAALTLPQLREFIKERKEELKQETASTTRKHRELIENANEVRLAVHVLLASKGLLGGIGPEVSEIAKRMNDSLATTTSAEAAIKARGFLARIFLGGNVQVGEALSQEVKKNQERIDRLTQLLGQATLSAELKAEIEAYIAGLKTENARLEALANAEVTKKGLFGWLR